MSTWCTLPDSDISISTAAARSCGFCRGYACDVALDRLIISPEFFHIYANHFISNTDLIEKLLPPRRPGSQVDLTVGIDHE